MSVSTVLLCGFGSDLEDGHDDEFQGTLTEILPPKGGEESDLDGITTSSEETCGENWKPTLELWI